MECPNCNTKNHGNRKSCNHCGMNFVSGVVPAEFLQPINESVSQAKRVGRTLTNQRTSKDARLPEWEGNYLSGGMAKIVTAVIGIIIFFVAVVILVSM